MVFHSPQASHLPCQRPVTAPQFWQTKAVDRRAIVAIEASAGRKSTRKAPIRPLEAVDDAPFRRRTSGAATSTLLSSGRTIVVDASVSPSQTGEHLIANGSGVGSQLVDANVVIKQGREISTSRAVFGNIGDIDCQQVHGDSSHQRAAATGDDGVGPLFAVGSACGSEDAIGVPDRRHRDAGFTLGRPGRPVTDGLAQRDIADLNDAPLKTHHGAHQIEMRRRWIGAIERRAGAHQVVMRIGPQKNSGGVGKRARDARKQLPHPGERCHLRRVKAMAGIVGAGKMTDDEVKQAPEIRAFGDFGGLLRTKSQAVDARVDVQGGFATPVLRSAESDPFVAFDQTANDGPRVGVRIGESVPGGTPLST